MVMRLYHGQPSGTVDQLKALRRSRTDAENMLLRGLRTTFPDRKWRFQAPIGPFRVDFLCFAGRLVVEVDGGQHAEAASYDASRTRFIESEGFRVLRFWNSDVTANLDGVLATIASRLERTKEKGSPA